MVVYGIYYALGMLAGAGAVTWLLGWPFALPFYILAAFCLYFFRDPERRIPDGPVAVSPADGKVVAIRPDDAGGSRISIFLNIFDVHVNRAPIAGRVASVEYTKGQFLVASKEQASHSNEQNTIAMDAVMQNQPTRVVFKQIAGLIARRIVCYVKAGDALQSGQRIGLIKFGSRVDIFLGPEWAVAVHIGEHVAGGSSIIARFEASGKGAAQ
jgi:phosphatidylserine decarboxylase